MTRSNDDLTLDGNAVGGLLAEVFGEDPTGMIGTCPDCGHEGALGTLRAYTQAPGVVLRCPSCDSVQLVVVRTPRGLRQTTRIQGV
jgi:DNA-directed RNA polymerase subunit RPC12/RpoP